MSKNGRVIWITGLSGSGKTTIGTRLYYRMKNQNPQVLLLDGDIIRDIFEPIEANFTVEGRKKRAYQYSDLCKMLAYQGATVICCTIAMYDDVRTWNRQNISNYHEIFIDVDWDIVKERDSKGLYNIHINNMVGGSLETELPKAPDVVIKNTMDDNIDQYIDIILDSLDKNNTTEDNYWNEYYKSDNAPKEPSGFAKFALTYMKADRKLIDLGCGNGRDSVFFSKNRLKVTAVDSSQEAINTVDTTSMPIFGVCDDFVSTKALFCVDYDYCYARWSIHAISQKQQDELLPNVYKSLKSGGLVFIEVRTINDSKFGQGEQLGCNEFFYDGHYRRFIEPESLIMQLKNTGFEIMYTEESDGFSKVNDDNPTLIRVIAKKCL